MTFSSTRDRSAVVGFRDAVLQGLAPDGGLFHPVETPDLRDLFLTIEPDTPFPDTAAAVVHRLLPDVFDQASARAVCSKAFPFSPGLTQLTADIHVLELFHGPSCAFKDFGASFLAAAMDHMLSDLGERAVILTATSGDTGSAVAHAFHGHPNIDVVILYPSGRVSRLQEQQLTTVGDNVTALEVNGSFDDCQRMVKEAFVDQDLRRRVPLTSANSINIGRLLPQVFYFVYAFQLLRANLAGDFFFCVPSGNFGNLTAGVFAWSWGLPADGFIAATNVNDVVPAYLQTGSYRPRASVPTIANAMDVGTPSNFERLMAIFDDDHSKISAMITGAVATDEDIRSTMAGVHAATGMLVDPHTAAGILGAQSFTESEGNGDTTIVSLATAHPAKFGEIVVDACGVEPDLPPALARAMTLEKRSLLVEPDTEALRHYLLHHQ